MLADDATKCNQCGYPFSSLEITRAQQKSFFNSFIKLAGVGMGIILVVMILLRPYNKPRPALQPTEIPTVLPSYIPGITPADIKINLEKAEVSCGAVRKIETEGMEDWYLWYCNKDFEGLMELQIEIFSRTTDTVDIVEATLMQFTDKPSVEAAQLTLGYIATLPFIDSEQDQQTARKWVEDNVATIFLNSSQTSKETTIDGIYFNVYGVSTAAELTIGKKPMQK